jgi:ABC-2 type transport system permease protein
VAATSVRAAAAHVVSSWGPHTSTKRVRPLGVVLARTSRQALRSGTMWGLIFGIYTALQAVAYTSTYKTEAERLALAKSLSSSGGLSALTGPARDLQTVGGYTAWKSLGLLSIMGAIWALLLATKLFRGEEEAGRTEVLLAGPTTRRAATVQTLVGLLVGLVALFACTSVLVALVGRARDVHWAASASLFYALSVSCGAFVFMAVGTFTSQLVASRRKAAAYAGAAVGIAFVVRMVSDASAGATWMHWITPFGWIEELGAFTSPSPIALLPLAIAAALLVAATIWLSGARDLGAGVLRERTDARAHTALLGGPVGLSVRLSGPTVTVWVAGISAFGLLLGGVANVAAKSLEASPSVRAALARLGGHAGLVKDYLGVSFLTVTLLVMLLAASQVTAARREEATGRVEHLLVQPVARARWMLSRLAIAAVAVVLAGTLAGVFAWLGSVSQHAHVGFFDLLEAGINVVPAGLFLLGIGALAWSLIPRHATACVYAVLVWSFLVEVLAGIGHQSHWLLDTSIFHHIAPAPAVSPQWVGALALVGLGALATALGVARFSRRDLAGS